VAEARLDVQGTDEESLARDVRIRAAGKEVLTPARALGLTRSRAGDLEILSTTEFASLTTFAEIYSSLTASRLSDYLDDNGERLKFETAVEHSLKQAASLGQIAYLLLRVQDSKGDPLNALPPDEELGYVFDLLWRPTNALVVTPMFGNLRDIKDYARILHEIRRRQETIGSKPVAITLPSVYRSLTRAAIEQAWKAGVRIFGLDLEGRSMGAQGTVISLANMTLGLLSKSDKEAYMLLGLNVKDHIGTGPYARVHNLLGHAYGFDVVGLNRVRRKGWTATAPKRREVLDSIRFAQTRDYGYPNVSEMIRIERKGNSVETDTPALRSVPLNQLKRMNPEYVRTLARLHNAAKDQREEKMFREKIETHSLGEYLMNKTRVREDVELVKRVAAMAKRQREL